jgi:hypothetical protein
MLSGFVDRHWARHHYRHWYDLTYGHADAAPGPALQSAMPAMCDAAFDERASEDVVAPTPQPRRAAVWRRLPGQILAIEGEAIEC